MPLFYFILYIVQLVTILYVQSHIYLFGTYSHHTIVYHYRKLFILYSFGDNSFRSIKKQRKKTNVPCHADRYHAKTSFAIVAKHNFCRYTVVYSNSLPVVRYITPSRCNKKKNQFCWSSFQSIIIGVSRVESSLSTTVDLF